MIWKVLDTGINLSLRVIELVPVPGFVLDAIFGRAEEFDYVSVTAPPTAG